MQQDAERLTSTALPAGEGFLEAVAAAMLEHCASMIEHGDLSSALVLAPSLPVASDLRSALQRAASRPVLLPRFDTLKRWAMSASVEVAVESMPDSERVVLLHEALRGRGWFDESALWGIASEMVGLFDELTTAAVALPRDAAHLAAQLQRAYSLRVSSPLDFEARVVHELWHALCTAGRPDANAAYRLRLAELVRHAERPDAPRRPLLVLLGDAPDASLEPAEHEFLVRYRHAQPVFVFHAADRAGSTAPLMATLAAAWPEPDFAPLLERSAALARACADSPLAGRLQLVPTAGRELEAQAAVAQIGAWLDAGLRRIVLIAQDRLTARRVRALLERGQVLVCDETGWKLSTSRAAAAVDALFETAAGDAYHRDLLDLCKSPYIFSDCDEEARKAAVFALEAAIRSASIKSGLSKFRRCLLEFDGASFAAISLGLNLLDRIAAATTLLHSRAAPLARWITRLFKALEVLGGTDSLRRDAAGKALLDLLELRRVELDGSTAQFSFAAWRDWLNREIESANFRDDSISSPVVLAPLNAVCMRPFEAAVLLGGDARQLAPNAGSVFFNQSVRRELGLRSRENAVRDLRRDLEMLLATVPRVVVTWQSERNGETNLPAPELALLSTLHQLVWHDDLYRPPLPARVDALTECETLPQIPGMAAPVAPAELIPRRVSVSAYSSLVACPYRFFSRHVLGLGDMDEVSEEMDKSDYGALVHRVLERFHERHQVLSDLGDEQALSAMRGCVAEVFAPAVEDNFLATGWRLRWEKRLVAYLDWQRDREACGWRWAQAEARASRVLPLDEGGCIELYGRIDRIDKMDGVNDACALLDYKTQTVKAISNRLTDDVQLPAYALLHGNAAQAAYVALDDECIALVSAGDDGYLLKMAAEAQGQRLQQSFNAMHAGARLPAHGLDSVCRYCEMSGLCRKEHVCA